MTREERFWAKVEKTAGCWLWKGSLSQGYGYFWNGQGIRRAHRYVYELLVGPIPDGLTIDHLCRTRACVNPEHLEVVTHTENVLRGESFPAQNARKTHCRKGHEFTMRADGTGRRCRACDRQNSQVYYERNREQVLAKRHAYHVRKMEATDA